MAALDRVRIAEVKGLSTKRTKAAPWAGPGTENYPGGGKMVHFLSCGLGLALGPKNRDTYIARGESAPESLQFRRKSRGPL